MIHTDEFRIRINGYECTYCGDKADTMDHYPPKSVSYHGLMLPCCRECNSSLGASHPFSFANRCKMAKDNIRRKFKRVLKMPAWDAQELEEMSYSMREHIKSCERTKKDRGRTTCVECQVVSFISQIGKRFCCDNCRMRYNYKQRKTIMESYRRLYGKIEV